MDGTQRRNIARGMGQRVRLGRTLRGFSLEKLADRAGIAPRRVRRIEEGVGGATAAELVAVARALDLPLWFVFDVPLADDSDACPVCDADRR